MRLDVSDRLQIPLHVMQKQQGGLVTVKNSLETGDADHDPGPCELLPQSMIMLHKSTKLDLCHGGFVGPSSS